MPGYKTSTLIAQARAKTNSKFGQPPDADIVGFANEAVEQVVARLDPILTSVPLSVLAPNSTTFVLPADVGRIKNIVYSTGSIFAPGTSTYEVVLLPFDEFVAAQTEIGVGGPGGIPTIAAIVSDTGNVMTLQFYPFVSTGFLNIYYYQRGLAWDPANPNSTSTLDSIFQWPVMIWTCECVLRAREMDDKADVYEKKFEPAINEAKTIVAKRRRKADQSNVVRDVDGGGSIWPDWMN
jgi:hypothetical protein